MPYLLIAWRAAGFYLKRRVLKLLLLLFGSAGFAGFGLAFGTRFAFDFDASPAGFGKANGDGLLAAFGAAFAAFELSNFTADEFTGLGGGCFTLSLFGLSAFLCGCCRHKSSKRVYPGLWKQHEPECELICKLSGPRAITLAVNSASAF